jgi:ABC-type glycerol-3-phosphate transport system substrate-binding protein
MLDTDRALAAADYLMELLDYSPPDILSMSWYERVRPYAAGKVAMAYGYTLLAPYFELDDTCPAYGNTGYLPHPHGPEGAPIAPVGGYALCIPANLAPERMNDVVEALVAFTSPAAQKLYVQNGSRTAPRYSVGADPEVRRLSPSSNGRPDVLARRAAVLAASANPADLGDHRDLRRRASRHAARSRDAARGTRPAQAEAEKSLRKPVH